MTERSFCQVSRWLPPCSCKVSSRARGRFGLKRSVRITDEEMSLASTSHDTSSSGDDSGFVFVASLSNTRNITQLLKAVHFKDDAVIYASANGLKVTVEESKCIQANAFIQADMFNHFVMLEDALTFKINLTILLECLNIFGGSSTPGTMTSLKMCYGGYGSPLILLLEEDGVVTNCSIKTQEPDDILCFDFTDANVVNKIIFKAECLKEAFMEMDMSSDVLEILMSPDKPYFRLSTFGDSCTFHMECPKDSEIIEMFQCIRTQTNRYKTLLIKPSVKALALANKISVRTDERGFLCFQFLILTEGGHICFVEYYCSPDEETEDDTDDGEY